MPGDPSPRIAEIAKLKAENKRLKGLIIKAQTTETVMCGSTCPGCIWCWTDDQGPRRAPGDHTDLKEAAERLLAALEKVGGPEKALFDAIAHGSPEHRAWLKKAIDDHFAGRPVRHEITGGVAKVSRRKTFDIWMEGAVWNDQPTVHASGCGKWKGHTFADACEAYVEAEGLDKAFFDKSGPTYKNRRFFDEEMSARATFG